MHRAVRRHDVEVLSYGNGLLVGELSLAACLERLKSASMGRLGINVDALPVVLPVRYVVDGNSIVIRTRPGTKLSAATSGAVVAFEVDHYDADLSVGWSVLVQGRANELTEADRLEHARSLPLAPISAGGEDDRFIEVELDIVTGRCIEPLTGPEASSGD